MRIWVTSEASAAGSGLFEKAQGMLTMKRHHAICFFMTHTMDNIERIFGDSWWAMLTRFDRESQGIHK